MTLHKLTQIAAVASLLVASAVHANPLFSLENLERERAALLSTLTDANLSLDERQRDIRRIYRRLTDIERMVLRDERITRSDKVVVKKAFANYDLTFLVHASAEHDRIPLSHWLTTLNIDEQTIAQARVGVR